MVNQYFVKKLARDIAKLESIRYLTHPEISPIHHYPIIYYSTILEMEYIKLRMRSNPYILAKDIHLIQELDLLELEKRECIYELLSALIKHLRPYKWADGDIRQMSLLDILRFCIYKKLYLEFSDIEFKEIYPGYYKVKLRVCKKEDIIYKLFDVDVSIGYIESVAYASIVNTTKEGNCESIEIDIANTIEQEWELSITVKFKIKTFNFSIAGLKIQKVYPLKLKASQGGIGEFVKLQKPYNYLREAIIHASNGVGIYFRDIKGNEVKLPTFWLCRKIYADYTIKQSACKTLGSSLSAIVFEPIISPNINSRTPRNDFFKTYPNHEYVHPPLAYSKERRALFFEIPAYGTIEAYKKRILNVPPGDLLTIIRSMIKAVESFRKKFGDHGLLTSWNIFLTSRGIKLGPPRPIANEWFSIPLEQISSDYQMLSHIIMSMAKELLGKNNERDMIIWTYIEKIAGALQDENTAKAHRILSDWEDRLL